MPKGLTMNFKIVSFGCSFTSYIYPTYADIIGADNRGVGGGGNERIFYHILQQYKKNKFENFDLITVQWSTPYRYDYLTRKNWTTPDGNIMESFVNRHIWKSIKPWYNPKYEEEKTENLKISVQSLLENTGKKYFITDIETMQNKYTGDYFFDNGESWIKKGFVDNHPTILQHFDYAQWLAKEFDFKLNPHIVDKCKTIHNQIIKTNTFTEYNL